jgi:hypothetical protein
MLDVLNCKLGDLKLSFDKSNPAELKKARAAVQKMLRDGFVIFVEHDGQTKRVRRFDPKCDCYIVQDIQTPKQPSKVEVKHAGTRKRKRDIKLPASKHRATAIAPRSGALPEHY